MSATDLVNNLIPFLASYSDLGGLAHEPRRYDDTMELASNKPCRPGNLRGHFCEQPGSESYRGTTSALGVQDFYPITHALCTVAKDARRRDRKSLANQS